MTSQFTGYPQVYDPKTDFSQAPSFNKAALDTETDALARYTRHLDEILRTIIRDDWNLKDGLVTLESLSPEVRELLSGLSAADRAKLEEAYALRHQQNADSRLAQGTPNEVTAAELRAHLNTDKTYVHEQASAATTWTIPHNLGFKPDVALRTTGGAEFDGEVLHLSDNTLQVYLVQSMAGFARLV